MYFPGLQKGRIPLAARRTKVSISIHLGVHPSDTSLWPELEIRRDDLQCAEDQSRAGWIRKQTDLWKVELKWLYHWDWLEGITAIGLMLLVETEHIGNGHLTSSLLYCMQTLLKIYLCAPP